MVKYFLNHTDKIITYILEHLQIVFISVSVAFVIAYIISMIMNKNKTVELCVGGFFNLIYAIPTLALFGILIPITGLGKATAIITLILYNQFTLTKNISNAFCSISENVIEAAKGIGLSDAQIYWSVKLPLALPEIISGLKLSFISTITMATLGATIAAGGLGELLFRGLSMKNWDQMGLGIILSSGLALIFSIILQMIENHFLAIAQGNSKRKSAI